MNEKLLKVYGHPRSGNHLLMDLLARNFYIGVSLRTGPGSVGHWADRVHNQYSKHGRLSGGHGLPQSGYDQQNAIYVYRDGRAVALSIYQSPHFMNPKLKQAGFSSFLRAKLDWYLTPGRPSSPGMNIAQHWMHHLSAWQEVQACSVRYEDLVLDPIKELLRIAEHFDLDPPTKWQLTGRDVGWFPSGNKLDGWVKHFNKQDNEYFLSHIPEGFYGIYESPGHSG